MSSIKTDISLDEKVGVYEIGYFLISSIPEEKVASKADSLREVITSKKGEIIGEEAPEKRPLAYSMVKKIGAKNHKFSEGYFGWVKFEMPTENIVDVKKTFENSDDVLRFLLIKTVKENTYLGKKAPLINDEKMDAEKVAPEGALDIDAVAQVAPVEEIDKSIDEMVKEA